MKPYHDLVRYYHHNTTGKMTAAARHLALQYLIRAYDRIPETDDTVRAFNMRSC